MMAFCWHFINLTEEMLTTVLTGLEQTEEYYKQKVKLVTWK